MFVQDAVKRKKSGLRKAEFEAGPASRWTKSSGKVWPDYVSVTKHTGKACTVLPYRVALAKAPELKLEVSKRAMT